ncbi:MAG: ABC transporter permease [Elusimicrobiales bacterium]|nr:ABC transporter permease [Elusimicrobiaceae bacterium]MDO5764666.1 ABC transporter permease [Elusimicrobiales bacterium]
MLKNRIFKRIFTNKTSLAGFILVSFFAGIALLAPLLAPAQNKNNPYQLPQKSYQIAPQPPSAQNWFGTTEQQYDLYYGVVWGTRLAFKVGVTVTFFAFLIGLFVGGTAAYFGGKVDETLMRLTDVVFAVPSLVLAMVIAAMLGPDIKNMMIALTAVAWPSYARLVRGDILSVKQRGYVTAARTLGARGPRILLRHILPNSIYPSVVVASLDIGYVVLTAASLSFLGLGAQPGTADWGQLIAMARNWVLGTAQNPFAYWYTVAAPGGAIFLFVLGWNLLGDAFRDILDPRQA